MGEIRNIRSEPRSDTVCVCWGFCKESAKARGIGWQKETAPTLISGDIPLILACLEGNRSSPMLYQDTIGSLCATDYKWVQQQQVTQWKLIVCQRGQKK